MILLSWFNEAKGRALAMRRTLSSSMAAASEAFRDVQSRENNPYKKVESSFRRIPPSRSNPTQNK
ncbi:hypothetical protein Ancab_029280 [Ancistrocladus abbreviatus]